VSEGGVKLEKGREKEDGIGRREEKGKCTHTRFKKSAPTQCVASLQIKSNLFAIKYTV